MHCSKYFLRGSKLNNFSFTLNTFCVTVNIFRVQGEEKRRLEARNLDESQVELLLFDNNELKEENGKLKNLLDWKVKKFDDEKNKLEEQVRHLGNLLEEANKQLQATSTQLRETNASKSLLEAEVKKKVSGCKGRVK